MPVDVICFAPVGLLDEASVSCIVTAAASLSRIMPGTAVYTSETVGLLKSAAIG
jgi:hypothetical protein